MLKYIKMKIKRDVNLMNELIPITRQEPGIVLLENYEEVKAYLISGLEKYKNAVYSEENIKDAKSDRASLRKIKKAISDKRKEIKAVYMAPYLTVEEKLKELESLVAEPIDIIDSFVKSFEAKEKQEKKALIKRYFNENASVLGELADTVFESNGFFDAKWLNASTKASVWQTEIREKITEASRSISTLQTTGGRYTPVLIAKYLETQSLDDAIGYHKTLKTAETATDVETLDDGDNVIGYKVLKINATENQMAQLINQLEMLGIDYEELEDGMPREQIELQIPDFTSFVAFDIETTGTFGAANGDAPAEITEIGAVKVINGEIVDRVDWLCNPGRKIVPRIVRLTNITDEMVAKEPPVSEVIRKFAEYAGDLPLVGHNIKSSDLHYISKAAKKAGVAIENPFFDTYLYAKRFKDKNKWANVKLEYLSDYYGIEQQSAHRAYCDAEANVHVYFKLKEESEK